MGFRLRLSRNPPCGQPFRAIVLSPSLGHLRPQLGAGDLCPRARPVAPQCSFGKNRRPHRFAPNAGMRCVLPASFRQCVRCLG